MTTNRYVSRRRFVTQAAGSGLFLGLGELPSLPHLPSVSADEVHQVQKVVRFASDLEPTIRFLEQTPRNQILEDLQHPRVAIGAHMGCEKRRIAQQQFEFLPDAFPAVAIIALQQDCAGIVTEVA